MNSQKTKSSNSDCLGEWRFLSTEELIVAFWELWQGFLSPSRTAQLPALSWALPGHPRMDWHGPAGIARIPKEWNLLLGDRSRLLVTALLQGMGCSKPDHK